MRLEYVCTGNLYMTYTVLDNYTTLRSYRVLSNHSLMTQLAIL